MRGGVVWGRARMDGYVGRKVFIPIYSEGMAGANVYGEAMAPMVGEVIAMSAEHSMAAIPGSLTGRALSCLTDAPRQLASPALNAAGLTTCRVGVTSARSLLQKGTPGNSDI